MKALPVSTTSVQMRELKLPVGFYAPAEELEYDPGLHTVQVEDSATIDASWVNGYQLSGTF